jgi:hypothetical protein
MRSARFCLIFTNAFGPVHRAFVSKQKPLPVRLSICSSNSKTVGQHWERILAYFDRRLIFENGKVVAISSLNDNVIAGRRITSVSYIFWKYEKAE